MRTFASSVTIKQQHDKDAVFDPTALTVKGTGGKKIMKVARLFEKTPWGVAKLSGMVGQFKVLDEDIHLMDLANPNEPWQPGDADSDLWSSSSSEPDV